MNIYFRELKSNLKSLFIWSACLSALFTIWIMEFSAFHGNPELTRILDSVPQAMLKVFSMHTLNLSTLSGFIVLVMQYVIILLGIHAVLLGSSILAKEERGRTAEFLYSLPVKRNKVVFHKMLAGITICVLLLAVSISVVVINSMQYEPNAFFFEAIKDTAAAVFIVQMIFFSIGIFISSIMKRYKKSGSYAVGVFIGAYIISVLIGFSEKLEFLKYATPFKYFEPVLIINEGRFESIYVIISVCIIAFCFIGTYILYPRRDLNI